MRKIIGIMSVAALLHGAATPGLTQYRQSFRNRDVRSAFGSRVRLERRDGSRVSGELLAAARDSVWLLDRDEMIVVPLVLVRSAQVRRPGIGATGILVWAVAGGLLTGGALTAACSKVWEEGCGAVFTYTMVSWGLVGGLAAAITRSPHRWLALDVPAFTPYARFPQGLPPRFAPGGRPASTPPP
ncbi:MAG TPA: hypothetical protein VNL18_07645 [Gemmatimonadales bacterium]|nr:hypothetical protein [Gemmatimonadales bacterium]